jgi:hypothetical protein
VQGVSPHKAYQVLGQAVERGSTHYAVLNVSNIREFVLGLDASARMLWDYTGYDPDRFLREWCAEHFGAAASKAERAYRQFFQSYVLGERRLHREMDAHVLPVLLDGLTLHHGERNYAALLSQMTVPRAEPVLPIAKEMRQLLTQVQAQRANMEGACAQARTVLSELEGIPRAFFEVNLLAQLEILLGLLNWLEAGAQAALAERTDDRSQCLSHVRDGELAMRRVRVGQALAKRGRWADWYRGDRKMNLGRAEHLTRQVIERAKEAEEPAS